MSDPDRFDAPPESMRLVGEDEDLGEPLWSVDDDDPAYEPARRNPTEPKGMLADDPVFEPLSPEEQARLEARWRERGILPAFGKRSGDPA